MVNLNHIVRYAMTLGEKNVAKKLVARAINTADTIRIQGPDNFTNTQLSLIFLYEAREIQIFAEYVESQFQTTWFQEAQKGLDVESMYLVFTPETNEATVSQDLVTLNTTFKALAMNQGVHIAERVRFEN